MRIKRIMGAIGALAITASMVLTACGDDQPQNNAQSSDVQLASDVSGGQQCMTAFTPEQKTQMTQYIASNGDSYRESTQAVDGSQKICIIETGPDGTMSQRYVDRREMDADQNHFGEYLMYSMLFGRSNALIGYGMLSGNLSFGDAMALQMLTGVNSRGGIYHPYQYTDHGWGYRPTTINKTVVNVYNGNSTARPTPFRDAKPPTTYRTQSLPTSMPQKVGEESNGKFQDKPNEKASDDLKSSKPATVKLPNPKVVAPPPSIPKPTSVPSPSATKPAVPTTAMQAPSKSAAPTTTTAQVPPPSTPKSTAPRPTSRPSAPSRSSSGSSSSSPKRK